MQVSQTGHKIQLHLSELETLELIAKLTSNLVQRQKNPTFVAFHETASIFTKDERNFPAVIQFFVGETK